MERSLLTYLTDHDAGPSFAAPAARRCRIHAEDPALQAFLDVFIESLGRERRALRQIIHTLGGEPSEWKNAASWISHKALRLKLSDALGRYDELSLFEELELLRLGVQGKRGMWALLEVRNDERLRDFDLRALVAQSDEQIAVLEEHRLRVGARLPARGKGPG